MPTPAGRSWIRASQGRVYLLHHRIYVLALSSLLPATALECCHGWLSPSVAGRHPRAPRISVAGPAGHCLGRTSLQWFGLGGAPRHPLAEARRTPPSHTPIPRGGASVASPLQAFAVADSRGWRTAVGCSTLVRHGEGWRTALGYGGKAKASACLRANEGDAFGRRLPRWRHHSSALSPLARVNFFGENPDCVGRAMTATLASYPSLEASSWKFMLVCKCHGGGRR